MLSMMLPPPRHGTVAFVPNLPSLRVRTHLTTKSSPLLRNSLCFFSLTVTTTPYKQTASHLTATAGHAKDPATPKRRQLLNIARKLAADGSDTCINPQNKHKTPPSCLCQGDAYMKILG